jgi:Lon protease-like protein
MGAERIPLFPLEVVLFPGTPLPLHIFEPRYKLMIHRCLENNSAFGVILARSDGTASVGCTAGIVKVVKKYSDGRMDILTIGQTAFRVLEIFNDQPYLEGAVEYLEEDTRAPAHTELQQHLLKLYEQCHGLIYGRGPQSPEVHAQCSVAFQIASELPLELGCKQELLEIRAEAERQSRLLERLNQWLPKLAHLERTRARAGGNGHGLG